MRRRAFNALLIFIAVALDIVTTGCGESPQAPSPVPGPSAVTLVGRIVDAETGAGLPEANFYIIGGVNNGRFTSTGNDGSFTLTQLEPGTLTESYATSGYTGVLRQDFTIVADTRMDFPLSRFVADTFTVSGRVTDVVTGVPLQDALITILDGPDAMRSVRSHSDGTFRLTDVDRGGFTLRVRREGYDSFFQGIRLIEDAVLDVRMRRAQESLSGTWTGTVTYGGNSQSVPELTLVHDGATLNPFRFDGAAFVPGQMFTFSGTLRDPSAIGSTTEISGTFDTAKILGHPRSPMTCLGSGSFTGSVNWTRLVINVPRVVYCDGEAVSAMLLLVRQE